MYVPNKEEFITERQPFCLLVVSCFIILRAEYGQHVFYGVEILDIFFYLFIFQQCQTPAGLKMIPYEKH